VARPAGTLLVLAGMLLATMAVAQGNEAIGVSPGTITVADAQPGETYHTTVSLQNQFDTASPFSASANGTAGSWTVLDSGATFQMAARSSKAIDVAITPPDGTGPGNVTGQVTFCREGTAAPSGSGVGTRRCVGVVLHVNVGGDVHRLVTWLGATAEDVQVGRSLSANVTARNDGNARDLAEARAEVTPFAGGAVLAQGNGSLELDPGQTGDVVIALGSSLPIGQYLVKVTSTDPVGFETTLDVKVTAEGVAPDGRLRGILHTVRVPAGKPLTLQAWFENTGDVPVASARFLGQVLQGDGVVAQIGSDPVAVPAHGHANITTVWTPAEGGVYRVVGHVEYDGYRTPDSESLVEVGPASGTSWLLVGIVVALFVAAVVLLVIVLRKRREPPRRPRG
jgi:hypothetical protein